VCNRQPRVVRQGVGVVQAQGGRIPSTASTPAHGLVGTYADIATDARAADRRSDHHSGRTRRPFLTRGPMTEYFGLHAIADRTGWRDKRKPVNAMARDRFFMFKRHRAGYPGEMWYCNDQPIRRVALHGRGAMSTRTPQE